LAAAPLRAGRRGRAARRGGGYLWQAGSTLHNAYATAIACHPVGSPACQDAVNNFNGLDNFLSNGIILQVFPVLIGTFIGAPLLAREMETGTFRYTWTQGFGRWRWTLAKLVALGLAVTAAAELFSLAWPSTPGSPSRSAASCASTT
jgi:hypothetical protein